ncbi:MAG: T9SS type A sorting domain-containing protein [Candidatus Kapaibacterium sp.]|jgi:hypothetical protein|nr:T9SS type A sorting domain-containing protein [Candidatus Kapabacteria bacterium]
MKYLIIMIVFIVSFVSVYSRQTVEININATNDIGNHTNYNTSFGISPDATDVLDTGLGELNLPPPSFVGFHFAFEFIDSTLIEPDSSKYYDRIWTNKDLRHYPVGDSQLYVAYKLIFRYGQGKKLLLNWNKSSIPDMIDSIFITDPMNGFLMKVDMKEVESLEWDHESVQTLNLHVYYNLGITSVDDQNYSELLTYPNPVENIVNLSDSYYFSHYSLANINGIELLNGKYNNKIDVSSLAPGLYFLKLFSEDKVIVRKILKK